MILKIYENVHIVNEHMVYIYSQVTLEEQMICGALQTLNEEAFEDVLGSERPSPTGGPSGELLAQQDMHTFVPHHLSQLQQSKQPQSQLAPIKEGTEQCSQSSWGGMSRRTTNAIPTTNNTLTGVSVSDRHNNHQHSNNINHPQTHSNYSNSHAAANHADAESVPTVIIMPTSFDNIQSIDDTRL